MDTWSIRHDVQRQVSQPTSHHLSCRRLGSSSSSHETRLTRLHLRRLDSWFFSKGQVIETHRGKGIYQKAIDEATYKLEQGQWVSPDSDEGVRGPPSHRPVQQSLGRHADHPSPPSQIHMFPEGRIKQEALHELRRFKWGVSRILMEVKDLPLVIPIWIKGDALPLNPSAPPPH